MLAKQVTDLSEEELDDFAEWIERQSHLPWLKLNIPIPYKEMLAEAKACLKRFVPHRSEHNKGWRSVCVYGHRQKTPKIITAMVLNRKIKPLTAGPT